MNIDPKRFGDAIQKLRADKGLSAFDVQQKSRGYIKDATVSKIENAGQQDISLRKLAGLAYGLDIPLIQMLELYYDTELVNRNRPYDLKDLTPEQKEYVDNVVNYIVLGLKQSSNKMKRVELGQYEREERKVG